MSTIVTRAGKGSPLTNNEVDANFVNLNTDKLQTLTSTDASVTITGTGSSRDLSVNLASAGDVNGPASATDNAITRFDGTTGKLIQNSTVTLDDTGNILNINSVGYDTTPGTIPTSVGTAFWDDGNGTEAIILTGGNVTLQVGQELIARVYNDSGVALVDGQVVYISGAQGNRIAVKLARADSEATSAGTLGVVTEPIAIGAEGFVTMMGTINQLNTTGLTAGSLLYLSDTIAGAYTETPPVAPNHKVTIGYVERVHATVGSIYAKVDNGYELNELHNVQITSPTGEYTQELAYQASTGVWKNYTKSTSTIAEGTNLYYTDARVRLAISASAPLTYSNTTGVFSIPMATSTVDGYLFHTDWITFNGKQDALVSGTNIKTINGSSVLGTGDLAISGLPSQTGNTGKYLTTDGATASWATVAASPGGATTNVQYNNAGAFAGSSSFTYNPTTNELKAGNVNATNGLIVNSSTVNSSYTIASGSNAFSVGPITTASGATVTVSAGQRWVVI